MNIFSSKPTSTFIFIKTQQASGSTTHLDLSSVVRRSNLWSCTQTTIFDVFFIFSLITNQLFLIYHYFLAFFTSVFLHFSVLTFHFRGSALGKRFACYFAGCSFSFKARHKMVVLSFKYFLSTSVFSQLSLTFRPDMRSHTFTTGSSRIGFVLTGVFIFTPSSPGKKGGVTGHWQGSCVPSRVCIHNHP